jgi:hypothetical protein
MKTGKEYYEMLSPKEKEQYMLNLLSQDKNEKHVMDQKYHSFDAFMNISFFWNDTPQGHEYWERISRRPEQPITTPYKSGIMLGIFIGFFTGTLLTMATRDWTYQLLGIDLLIVAGIVYLYKKYREE